MSITQKVTALNDAPLTGLEQRLAALRAEMERDLVVNVASASAPPTPAPTAPAAPAQTNALTPEQLIAALTRSKRSAL